MTTLERRWVTGIDLRPHSHGAINFSRWLHAHDEDSQLSFDALHVVDTRALELPEAPSRTELVGRARSATQTALKVRSALELFDSVSIVDSDSVVETLDSAGVLRITAGLILGRRAAGEDQAFIRLGRVARRMLRRLPCPVFVVPSDLELHHVGMGPIVCAVELDDQGLSLVRHARALGVLVGRPVHVVHVVGDNTPVGFAYVPETAWDQAHEHIHARGKSELEAWLDAAGHELESSCPRGRVVPTLIAKARELDACMILSSSRRLSATERLFISSVGSTLAAAAHVPVGIIPPKRD